MALSIDFRGSVSFPPGYPSYRTLTFVLVGLTPTEYTCLFWTYADSSFYLDAAGCRPSALPSAAQTACVPWCPCPGRSPSAARVPLPTPAVALAAVLPVAATPLPSARNRETAKDRGEKTPHTPPAPSPA